ncbi:PH domain-containing protein [Lysinibacillus sp. 54212]|uniref:PH domain-containing protein n=1 Tax=Lysinibacillus sp. 54212 TaxID=3119829 RepID=UPI002FC89E69
MSSEKYKLHPVTALINFFKALKELLLPIIILFIANGFNFNLNIRDKSFFSEMVPLIILLFVVIYTFFAGIIKWWTFKYWFEDSELRVEYGLLVRKKRYIPFDRIQSLNYKEGIFHRMFGLVQVTVETAGNKNGKPEAELTAITRNEADRIEQEMNRAKQKDVSLAEEAMEAVQQPVARVIHKMSPKDLVILATTSNSIGVVIAGVAAVFSQVAQYIPFEWVYEEFGHLVRFSAVFIALLVFMTFLFSWIVSVAITLINYFDFTVTEEQERIIITRGLLEKKRITIPLNRVQAIKIVENPFRQLFGLSTVVVENAGGGYSTGKEKKIVLFPLISKKRSIVPLQSLFPHYELNVMDKEMVRPPKKARAFFYRIDFLWLIPLIAIISYSAYPYGLLSLLIVVPVILLGIWQHRTARFIIQGNQLTIIYRHINRVTFIVEKKRIQIAQQSQTYFQKRKGLATARVVVMSGMTGAEAKAYYMEQRKIEEIMKWYSH